MVNRSTAILVSGGELLAVCVFHNRRTTDFMARMPLSYFIRVLFQLTFIMHFTRFHYFFCIFKYFIIKKLNQL